ncbi:hypothetical protein GT034_21290 [Streptomyces sp. SID2563]|nr:hypothetical protein [Streptomyces sp. SID2563]MYW10860.1 hypothetical protein [Streptomyces sp. SID2563]
MRSTVRRLLGCVLLAVALIGCDAAREKPEMDMQQAGERAEGILDGTMAAIRPPVGWSYGNPSDTACSTGLNEPTGTTTVFRSRKIDTVVSGQRRGELLKQVREYWEQRGARDFTVDSGEGMPRIRARTADGFAVILQVGSIGNVFIEAGISCVEDSEMTYPRDTPGVPGSSVKPEGLPRKYSAHWSETAPH